MSPSRRAVYGYAAAAGSVCLAILATFAVRRWIGPSGSLLFFPAVVAVAMQWGYSVGLAATGLSTVSLAYFFVEPTYSFDIGTDDLVRLIAFAAVAIATAWMASARRNAEDSLLRSIKELRSANATLQRVTDWPILFGGDAVALTREMLQYAASVVGATEVFAIWEADGEHWVYLAAPSRPEVITRRRPDDRSALVSEMFSARWPKAPAPRRITPNPALDLDFAGKNVAAVPFRTENLAGRVFFAGMTDLTATIVPAVELVAREVGRSLDQLRVADRIRGVAAEQERARLARSLHDGVLQSLRGIRIQVQGLSSDHLHQPATHERLSTIEQALADEQRELQSLIDRRPAD